MPASRRKGFLNRLGAFFEVLVVALSGSILTQVGLTMAGIPVIQVLTTTRYLFIFLISEATITLLLILILLRLRGEDFRKIGWDWRHAGREALTGVLAIPILFGATLGVSIFFRYWLPQYVSTTNPLLDLIETPQDLALFLISSIYVGGFKEEVQRAFVLVRFNQYLGGLAAGLILWSIFFAVGHNIQGVDNAVGAGVLGFLFGLLFIWRRKLIAPMLAHAAFDLLTLVYVWTVLKA
ncbi:MAG: CPBP family intramembrane glutamic endopeptidase [Acidobacteriota bacterium]